MVIATPTQLGEAIHKLQGFKIASPSARNDKTALFNIHLK